MCIKNDRGECLNNYLFITQLVRRHLFEKICNSWIIVFVVDLFCKLQLFYDFCFGF